MTRAFYLSALVLLPFSAAPAFAACVESPTNNYVCDGTSAGFTDGSDGVTATVNVGATVTRSSSDGIRVRGIGSSVTNNGTIRGTGPLPDDATDGIDGGEQLTVTNSATGTITGTNRGIDADGKNDLTVSNRGTISAVGKAIRNSFVEANDEGDPVLEPDGRPKGGRHANIINHVGGLIESETDEGIESGDFARIENAGTIIAQDDAIQVDEDAEIINSGTIRSRVNVAIGAEQQDAIDIDSGTITNTATGLIISEANAAIDFDGSDTTSTITNRGRIAGTTGILVDKGIPDPLNENTAAQIMLNYGIIEGYDGLAVDVGAGDDELSLFGGSTLIGGIDMGTGDDTLNLFEDLAGSIAGGAVLDGGADIDLVDFRSLTIADVARAVFDGTVFRMKLNSVSTTYSVALSNWEGYKFDGVTYDRDQILAVAPVPLPAAGLMMLAGLGGLSLLRRRHA
jgi:hypothetical protein